MRRWIFGLAGAVAVAVGLIGGGPGAQASTTVILDFEGVGNLEQILDFYDGGYGGYGSGPGPDYGITFGPDALALIDADAGGSGNFANAPSGSTISFFLTGPGVVMNVEAGFTTGFSFFYTSAREGTVTVFDGPDGTGSVLATVPVEVQYNTCGASGDPSGAFACWTEVGVTFSGTAFSVNFGGVQNYTGFDEITLGSATPGAEGIEKEILVSPGEIEIDIKPGSNRNPVNPNGKGVIPVALMGSDSFDVTTVDVTTLTFGSDATPAHDLTDPDVYADHLQDGNSDGFMDLVSHYRTQDTGITKGDAEACLTGETTGGVAIWGCDDIKTVGK